MFVCAGDFAQVCPFYLKFNLPFHGEGNQARLGSTAEDTGGTSMSKERSNEAPNQECVICFDIIDVNDCNASVHSPCDHIFHHACLLRWMQEKVRF